jgi:hypothetical protein
MATDNIGRVALVPGDLSLPRQMHFVVAHSLLIHGVLSGLHHPGRDNFGDGDVCVLPIKFIYDPRVVVKVKLVEIWVPSLFYTKIALRLPGFEAPQRMNEGIRRVRAGLLTLQLFANGRIAHRLTVTVETP